MIKRFFDLVAATIGLVLLAPVMAITGILVRRDSEGPAFFRQERIGRGGRPFNLLKFRSMASVPETSGPLITSGGDPRITRVGARLRAKKIDELPHLINALRGEMSVVGPRPELAGVRRPLDRGGPVNHPLGTPGDHRPGDIAVAARRATRRRPTRSGLLLRSGNQPEKVFTGNLWDDVETLGRTFASRD